MRGRRPRPTSLKLLEGNPGHRPINENEPRPAIVVPACPSFLRGIEKKEWRRISTELEKLGLLTRVDQAALTGYCLSFGKVVEAHRKIAKEGMVSSITTKGGNYAVLSPWWTILNRALNQMRAFLVEFGMTPSSRTRIKVSPEMDDEEFESLLTRVK